MKGLLGSTGWQNFLTLAAVYGVIVASVSFVTGVYAKQAVVSEIREFKSEYDNVSFYVTVLLELKRQEDPDEFREACKKAMRMQRQSMGELCKD